MIGGLGNQLFQYAAGRALAHKHGTRLKLDTFALDQRPFRAYCLDNFNISAERATVRDIWRLDKTEGVLRVAWSILPKAYYVLAKAAQKTGRFRFRSRYYDEYELAAPRPPLLIRRVASQRIFDFDQDFFNLPDDVVLIGTWISYKYFEPIRQILLTELSVKPELSGKNLEMARQIKNTRSVSVHVRRTDKANEAEYFVTDPNYVNRAMSFFCDRESATRFYVFSDDIAWCKANIKRAGVTFIDWNDDARAYEDLRLMSLCRHNILAESSFSWWGAYLNQNQDKTVITPPASRWIRKKNFLCTDILPPEWQVLE